MNLKLDQKKTFLVGLAFLSIMLFWTMYDTVVAKMLIDNFGLNQTWSGFVMALDNIFALFMLPFFGRLSDKTKTKYGKRTPFILIGTVIAAVLIVGVGVFDLLQQQALTAHNISAIFKEGEVFRFTVDGIVHENAVKSVLATERSLLVFNTVTKASPGFLIGFIVVLFFVLVAMGIYRSPAVSLMPDVTPKPLRSKANAVINLMGTVGGIISYGYMLFLANDGGAITSKYGYVINMAVTGLLMVIIVAIFFFTVKENEWAQDMLDITAKYNLDSLKIDEEGVDIAEVGESEKMPKEVRKSFILLLSAIVLWFFAYNAATSKFSVYASNHLGISAFSIPPLVATLSAAVAFIPIGILSQKFGRRKMILTGIVGLTISFTGAIFVTNDTQILMYIVMALVGVSWALINVNSYPMVVEMSKFGSVGMYTGYYYTASMAAMIVTPILSGFIMDVTKHYESLFIYSAIFSGLSFIPMFFVKHGEPVKYENNEAVEE